MKISKYGWEFNVDIRETELIYSRRLKSSIDAGRQLPELVSFLNELGIDIEKPDEYSSDFSDAIYTYSGSAKSEIIYFALKNLYF